MQYAAIMKHFRVLLGSLSKNGLSNIGAHRNGYSIYVDILTGENMSSIYLDNGPNLLVSS